MKFLAYDAYVLKLIAVVAMVLNHIAIGWAEILPLGVILPLYAVGGLTYSIMAFFIVEGYRHTSDLKKYIGRLLIFGVVAQAFHPMILGDTAILPLPFFNIMFAIALALVVLFLYDNVKSRVLFWLLFVVACILSLIMDLFIVSVLVPLLYHSIKTESRRRTVPGVVMGLFFILSGAMIAAPAWAMYAAGDYAALQEFAATAGAMSEYLILAVPTFGLGALLGAVLIRNFNDERGKRSKWLFYVAYPAHLAILAGIGIALGVVSASLFGFAF
ncbi:MAG: conjugal transfer protein TraX [Turicibacter sp.]|nr:conjugal transfer protein TraX [Turicibacter sp.]